MKKINYFLLIPILQSIYLIYRGASLADGLILAIISSLIGLVIYLSSRYSSITENKELAKLEDQLKKARLQLSIDQTEEALLREKMVRDSRSALLGDATDKQMRW
jgi:hypothetical protein